MAETGHGRARKAGWPQRFRRRWQLSMFICLLGLAAIGAASLAVSLLAAGDRAESPRRVIVLGIDAMDYALTKRLMAEGRLPNLSSLARRGSFMALQTSMPPLSPVAWANFSTGMDSGGHGIFDFLRRRPARVKDGFLPENSVSEVRSDRQTGERRIPFSSYVWPPKDKHVLLRCGATFWDVLAAKGIPATVYKMPANFPVSASRARALSGMGTPDIEGTYGTFAYLTDRAEDSDRKSTGGRIFMATVSDGVVRVTASDGKQVRPWLCGPINPFLSTQLPLEARRAKVAFDVYVDRAERSAAIVLQDQDVVVKQGEWSGWVQVRFELLPHFKSVSGLVRFYLQEASPGFRLFVSPINLAPGTEGLATQDFDRQLQSAVGPYYTKGMSEQTKALTEGIFSVDEYIVQSDLVLDERLEALQFLLDEVQEGLLFFYISTLDLDSHVMWEYLEIEDGSQKSEATRPYSDYIPQRYVRMDNVVGSVVSSLRPQDLLYVMSDHGFAPFRREFNLVRWLEQEGYLVYKSPLRARISESYVYVDWDRTRAYGVGFNGLFINLCGREARGAVDPADYDQVVDEIRAKLLAFRDSDGRPVFRSVYRAAEIYSGDQLPAAPDLILGYDRGYGASDQSVLGTWCEDVVAPHDQGFSGQHFMDYKVVPGVLFSTRKLRQQPGRLQDVTATVLKDFGVPACQGMTGRPLY